MWLAYAVVGVAICVLVRSCVIATIRPCSFEAYIAKPTTACDWLKSALLKQAGLPDVSAAGASDASQTYVWKHMFGRTDAALFVPGHGGRRTEAVLNRANQHHAFVSGYDALARDSQTGGTFAQLAEGTVTRVERRNGETVFHFNPDLEHRPDRVPVRRFYTLLMRSALLKQESEMKAARAQIARADAYVDKMATGASSTIEAEWLAARSGAADMRAATSQAVTGARAGADADVARHVDLTRRARGASADAREATDRMLPDLRATSERLEANRRRAHASRVEAMRAGADEAAANSRAKAAAARLQETRASTDAALRTVLAQVSEAVGRLDASRLGLVAFEAKVATRAQQVQDARLVSERARADLQRSARDVEQKSAALESALSSMASTQQQGEAMRTHVSSMRSDWTKHQTLLHAAVQKQATLEETLSVERSSLGVRRDALAHLEQGLGALRARAATLRRRMENDPKPPVHEQLTRGEADLKLARQGAEAILTTIGLAGWTDSEVKMADARGMCMDVVENSKADGGKVHLWSCNQGASQTWSYMPDSQQLKNTNSDKCLDLSGGEQSNGSQLQIWSCDAENANQKWEVVGGNVLRKPGTNKCVDISGGSMVDGSQIQVWDCHDGAAQKFQFP
jgi:stress response protein YsnF